MDAAQQILQGARFCDLFAGSGAVGIEALSRGAGLCVFVEQDRVALRALDENLHECERRCLAQDLPPPSVEVFRGDILAFLGVADRTFGDSAIPRKQYHFDFIWADPPYAIADSVLPDLLKFADQALSAGGVLMVESGAPLAGLTDATTQPGESRMHRMAEKKYGGTYLTSWKKQ